MDKKGIAKIGIMALLLITGILISLYVFAETAEEEKARLLEEKQELEQRLLEIDNGKWVNVSVEQLIANTTYSELIIDNSTTIDDLVPLELKCGDYELYNKDSLISSSDFYFVLWNGSKVKLVDAVNNELPIRAIYAENYNCDDIGYWAMIFNDINHQTLTTDSLTPIKLNEVGR